MIFRKSPPVLAIGLLLTGLFLFTVGCSADEAGRVVILANSADPDSLEVASYYAEKRKIPSRNIIALDMPVAETIGIDAYVATIHNPLLEALLEKGFVTGVKALGADAYGRTKLSVAVHEISYLVTVSGVPLRIGNDPERIEPEQAARLPKQFQVNQGSVDGELALLVGPPHLSMTAFVPNPLFSKFDVRGGDAARVVRVSRLDGPSKGAVLKMIDRTLEAEEKGLAGRAYFDIGGPVAEGDRWMNEAADLAVAAHFDTDIERSKRPMDFRERFDAPAIYMGWYRPHAYGPWREPKWPVPPGAIGFHLHSFSATTVRSTKSAWLGAFVHQGYSATMGNVYEPYLEYTHRPQMLLSALLEGRTFGEAIAYSTPALSWMGVAIGDPLYRPFKKDLDAQLEGARGGPFDPYLAIRQVNRLKAESGDAAALAYARSEFMERPSLPLAFVLAKLFAGEGKPEMALQSLNIFNYLSEFELDEVILVKQIADFLLAQGEPSSALDLYRKLNSQDGLKKPIRQELLDGGAAAARAAGDSGQANRWSSELLQLKGPAQPKK